MESNQVNIDIVKNQIDIQKKKNIKNYLSNDDLQTDHYLYPNGHRLTHQMKWFKGSRDMGLRTDLAG